MVNQQSMAAVFHASHPNVFPPAPPGVQVGGPPPAMQAQVLQPGIPGQGPSAAPNPVNPGVGSVFQGGAQQQAHGPVHPGAGGQAGG